METKFCVKCVTIKPLIDFFRDRKSKDGRTSRCRECARTTKMRHREYHLKVNYGIDHSRYLALLELQGGLCAICKGSKTGNNGTYFFAVDHDHATGAVRGLLCQWCNRAIGQFFENITNLENAITYLRAHGK